MDPTSRSEADNDLYNRLSNDWWSERGFGALLRHFSNPWRLPYFDRILERPGGGAPARLLDVGCGGGILAEEFAAMGFSVTGLDPSSKSLDVARAHASRNGLRIDYQIGHGHALPFADETFEVVACCDALEHIRDWGAVIGEIARVLKPKGTFVFDTINRTAISNIFVIKLAQEWSFTRYMPPGLHAWAMFITPEELRRSLTRHGLEPREFTGTKPEGSPLQALLAIRRYKKGRISAAEFARLVRVREGPDMAGFYMGHAVKP